MTTKKKNIADKTVNVSVAPHPFSVERVTGRVAAGATVRDIVAGYIPAWQQGYCHVLIDGEAVPQDVWHRVRPKAGHLVTVRMVPMGGGGGKSPLRTVLSLAIAAAAPALGGAVLAGMGVAGGSFLSFAASQIVSRGIGLAGNLLLNSIAPPGRQKQRGRMPKESQTLFIAGARNELIPFGRVPRVLGRHRMVPPLGAKPYTETQGNDQYVRMLFVWGYGPLEISRIRIGETDISAFDGVEMEHRAGYMDDPPLTLFSRTVLQNDLEVFLRAADGYVMRTSENDADEIVIDLTFPRGLARYNASGVKQNRSVKIDVQYAPTGTDDWSAPISSYKPIAAQTLTLPARPMAAQHSRLGIRTAERVDCVLLDAASGVARIVTGSIYYPGVTTAPSLPSVPSGSVLLATVTRTSAVAGVTSGQIADRRHVDMVAARFENAGDFVVTKGSGDAVTIAAGGLKFPGVEITAQQSAALRRSVKFKVAKGKYDVRVRRVTNDVNDDKIFDDVAWTALKTVRSEHPVHMKGLAMTAVRIRATDQLSGMLERFNGIVQSIVPDLTDEGWQVRPTSNPAALYRYVLQGRENARPLDDTRIDLARIEAWHARCAAQGRCYDSVIDYDVSVRDVLDDIAAAGRASPAIIDGRWGVVEDTLQTAPVQMFSPRNSSGFEAEKIMEDAPDALRVRFINAAADYAEDECIVYADGMNAQTAKRFETLEFPGVTSRVQAIEDATYHMRCLTSRTRKYSFMTEMEHIVCTRGDRVMVSHDVPMFGMLAARVKTIIGDGTDVTGIIIDENAELPAGQPYAMRYVTEAGVQRTESIMATAGVARDIHFLTPVPSALAPLTGGHVFIGISGQESRSLVVTAIEPLGGFRARVTCVDAAPEIHASVLVEDGEGNEWSPETVRPPTPVVVQVQSGIETFVRNVDGTMASRVIITLQPPVDLRPLEIVARVRSVGESVYALADMSVSGPNQISILGLTEDERYDIQVQYRGTDSSTSLPAVIGSYRVLGVGAPPENVSVFSVATLGTTNHLTWRASPSRIVSHYHVRFTSDTTFPMWDTAFDCATHVPPSAVTLALPAQNGVYIIRAVDTYGRMSAPVAAMTQAPGILAMNVVHAFTEAPVFGGDKSEVLAADGRLHLSGIDSIDDWPAFDDVSLFDVGQAGFTAEGIYRFSAPLDLGSVYACGLTAVMRMSVIDLENTIDVKASFDDLTDMDGASEIDAWNSALEMRTSDYAATDDVWSEWTAFHPGTYCARSFDFRMRLQSFDSAISPAVTKLDVVVDMPDRTETAHALVSSTGGTTCGYAQPFRALPSVGITAHDMQTGDYYRLTDIGVSGFKVTFYGAGGTPVARTFDYIAKGYGFALA